MYRRVGEWLILLPRGPREIFSKEETFGLNFEGEKRWQLPKRAFQIVPGDVYETEGKCFLIHKRIRQLGGGVVRIKSSKALEITQGLIEI